MICLGLVLLFGAEGVSNPTSRDTARVRWGPDAFGAGDLEVEEGGFDAGVDFGGGEFGGYADAVHDRLIVGGAVAYDADAAYAEHGGSAVFAVVETLFEGVESGAGEQGADLGGDGGFEAFAQGGR